MDVDFNKIKLVIWDLDDTFWHGTLSEDKIVKDDNNVLLIKQLTDCGIINSICSKNAKDKAMDKLRELQVADYFVFNSIDWTPKGERIARMIAEMHLRPVNTLFIDDNVVNLNEAKFYSPDLVIATPDIIPLLLSFVNKHHLKGKKYSRLEKYKVLESKQQFRFSCSTNIDFLYSTKTVVKIKRDCILYIDRIYELVQRTNQLNYTKKRCSKEELTLMFSDSSFDCGYIQVSDRFGNYGIVGFFAIKNHVCEHFLFSCRTIGQGVEQYVYSKLDYPNIVIKGEVVSELKRIPAPKWINQEDSATSDISSDSKHHSKESDEKVVFLGPCDLKALISFIQHTDNIITELTYISSVQNNSIQHGNHSINYLNLPFYTEKQREIINKECIFNDDGIFHTHIYDKDVKLVVISSLNEAHLGVYQKKNSEFKIAFAPYIYPITDKENWKYYLEERPYDNKYTLEWLEEFSSKYIFRGRLSPSEYIENLQILLTKISPKAHVCVMLGSEIPFPNEKDPTYKNRHLDHKLFNSKIKEFEKAEPRIHVLDINDCVAGSDEYMDIINHFQRIVYYRAYEKLNVIVKSLVGKNLKKRCYIEQITLEAGRWIKIKFHPNSNIYRIFHNLFFKIVKQ